MSAIHRIGLLLLVGFAFVLGNSFAGAQGEKTAAKVQKWEHKQASDFKEVEALGSEGWELVAIEPAMPYVQRDSKGTTLRSYYLKRPKQ